MSNVTVEITPEMIAAAEPILDAYEHDWSDQKKCLRDIFKAMLAAAPSQACESTSVREG
jgi:hypothetical protein